MGDEALRFIDVKAIQSVVAMVPHRPVMESQAEKERFFLVEKPGFDVALMAGVEEDTQGEDSGPH
jgi:hypothetical protein